MIRYEHDEQKANLTPIDVTKIAIFPISSMKNS